MRNFGCVMGDLYRVGIPMTFLTSDAEGDLSARDTRRIAHEEHNLREGRSDGFVRARPRRTQHSTRFTSLGNRGIDAVILEELASVTEVSGPTRVAVEAMVDFVAGVLPSATNRAVRATVKKIRGEQFENLAMLMSISDESMVRAQACNTIIDEINGRGAEPPGHSAVP